MTARTGYGLSELDPAATEYFFKRHLRSHGEEEVDVGKSTRSKGPFSLSDEGCQLGVEEGQAKD